MSVRLVRMGDVQLPFQQPNQHLKKALLTGRGEAQPEGRRGGRSGPGIRDRPVQEPQLRCGG